MREYNFPMFNEEKAIASAAYLLKLQCNISDKYWLAKVMYYVERESLLKNGQPLFSDQLYSIPYGPIASAVNDGIDLCAYPADSSWSKFFSLKDIKVNLIQDADYSVLSPFEKNLIKEAYQKFKGWDFNKLHDFFSKLPEYKETNSRETISYEEIFAAGGYDSKTTDEALKEISYIQSLESSLNSA
jgi:hypothetical protein